MEILTDINTELKLRSHIIKGIIDVAELTLYLKQLYSKSAYNLELNVFWDLREADFSSVSSEEVRSFMNYVSIKWGKSGKNKAALIVSQDLAFGMSRMYQMLMENSTPSQIAIFKDIDEAKKWIMKE